MKQRIIKFRIWDNQMNIFVDNSNSLHCFSTWSINAFTGEIVDYVGSIDTNSSTSAFISSPNPPFYFKKLKVVKKPRYIKQQFVNLKDFKGIDIYEGDIVVMNKGKLYESNYTVIYNDCSFELISSTEDSDEFGVYRSLLSKHVIKRDNIYVIGNIFQNPELTKKS